MVLFLAVMLCSRVPSPFTRGHMKTIYLVENPKFYQTNFFILNYLLLAMPGANCAILNWSDFRTKQEASIYRVRTGDTDNAYQYY